MHFKDYKKLKAVYSKKEKNMIDPVQNLNKIIVKWNKKTVQLE